MRVKVSGFRETVLRLTQGLAQWHADGKLELPGGVVLTLPEEIVIRATERGIGYQIEFPEEKPRIQKVVAGFRLAGPISEIWLTQDARRAELRIMGLPDVTVEFIDPPIGDAPP